MSQFAKTNLLSLNDVANRLKLHKSTVSRLIKAGEIPCCRIGGRVLIRELDLIEFIDNRIGVGGNSGSRAEVHNAQRMD